MTIMVDLYMLFQSRFVSIPAWNVLLSKFSRFTDTDGRNSCIAIIIILFRRYVFFFCFSVDYEKHDERQQALCKRRPGPPEPKSRFNESVKDFIKINETPPTSHA